MDFSRHEIKEFGLLHYGVMQRALVSLAVTFSKDFNPVLVDDIVKYRRSLLSKAKENLAIHSKIFNHLHGRNWAYSIHDELGQLNNGLTSGFQSTYSHGLSFSYPKETAEEVLLFITSCKD